MLGLSNSLSSSVAGSPAMQGSPAPVANTNSYSILLDGTNDYLTQPDNDNLFQTFSGANVNASMSFYIKMAAGLELYPIFWKSWNSGVAPYIWRTDSSGDLIIQHTDGFGVGNVWHRGWSTGFSANTWYHVVITTDGSATNRVTKCYVDGTEQTANFGNDDQASSVDLEAGSSRYAPSALFIGAIDPNQANATSNMYIDQIATWTSVLTQSAVTEIYTNNPNLTSDSGNYRASSSLDRYHKIEENTGTTSVDSSGNSNAPLTLVNGAAWSTDKPW